MMQGQSNRIRWMITAAVLLLLGLPALANDEAAPNTLRTVPFELVLDPQKMLLPAKLIWREHDVPLLADGIAMAHHFTAGAAGTGNITTDSVATDHVTLVLPHAVKLTADSWDGLAADVAMPHAMLKRVIWLHEDQPRVRIDYHFAFTRDLTAAESQALNVTLTLAPSFTQKRVARPRGAEESAIDVVEQTPAVVMATAFDHMSTLLSDPRTQTHVLAQLSTLHVPQEPTPVPSTPSPPQPPAFKKGDKLHLSIELTLARGDDTELAAKLESLP